MSESISEVRVVAHLRARPEKSDLVAAALEALVAPTREEAGCLQYDLLQDLNDSSHFVFYERWESAEAHQVHMDSEHLAEFVTACKGALEEGTISHLKKVL